MPKERLHLLLAREVLQRLIETERVKRLSPPEQYAYYLGSIWPDHLFYDLPSFWMRRTGRAFHILQGPNGMSILAGWVGKREDLSEEAKVWLLGIACHFLADHLWHPLINRLSHSPESPCLHLGLSPQECHHQLESDLEVFWLAQRAVTDGFIPLLRELSRDSTLVARLAAVFQDLLTGLGISAVPSIARSMRCIRIQIRLIRLFASPGWRQKKRLLLRHRSTQPLGSFINPDHSELVETAHSHTTHNPWLGTLYDPAFFEETVSFSASRLLALPIRW